MKNNHQWARVLNLLRATQTRSTPFSEKALAVRRLMERYPDARQVRFEGKCPNCRRTWLMSFVLGAADKRADGRQNCGYFCAACNWGNAGSREGGK